MQSTAQRYARHGFTLIEILIAVAIIGLMAAVVGPAAYKMYEGSKRSAAEASLRGMKEGISLYQVHTNQLPATLKDLIKKPRDERASKKWQGTYIGKEGITEVPRDPWDNNFVYKVTPGGKHPYELYSYGPKGKGSPKDEWIDAWDE